MRRRVEDGLWEGWTLTAWLVLVARSETWACSGGCNEVGGDI